MMGPSPGVFRAVSRDFVVFVVVVCLSVWFFWPPHGHVGSQFSRKGSNMQPLGWKHGNSEAPGKSFLGTLDCVPSTMNQLAQLLKISLVQ